MPRLGILGGRWKAHGTEASAYIAELTLSLLYYLYSHSCCPDHHIPTALHSSSFKAPVALLASPSEKSICHRLTPRCLSRIHINRQDTIFLSNRRIFGPARLSHTKPWEHIVCTYASSASPFFLLAYISVSAETTIISKKHWTITATMDNANNTQPRISITPAYTPSTTSSGSTQRHASSGNYPLSRWLTEAKSEQPWSHTNPRVPSQSGASSGSGGKK